MPLSITIHVDADFTPPGKRTARVVRTDRGGRQLRWYVSGRLYHRMGVSDAAVDLTRRWISDAA